MGRNGAGKTTLLRAIANREFPGIPTGLSILHVEQEVSANDEHGRMTLLVTCDR